MTSMYWLVNNGGVVVVDVLRFTNARFSIDLVCSALLLPVPFVGQD